MTKPHESRILQLSFFDHLDELRSRLIKSLFAILFCSIIFYSFLDPFLKEIVRPVKQVVFTSPAEAFTARIFLTFLGGFLLALPIVFYQIWQFVAAGLTEKERRYVRIFGVFSFLSFVGGIIFGYFVMLPISLQFLLGFSSESMVPMITVGKYFSFVGSLVLACGIVFELPLILLFLTYIGIATPEFLRQKRRYAIVLIFIVSAIVTPPDVLTQLLMAVPLMVLYEVGVFFSQWMAKRRAN
ncbi:MAG: twin-arginine translocase subunit TatC [Candidatus Omnitrophica bacterium]|nr:twin-arginine translocase subunit TatC [Candidatus Omnitrophota bacterium]